MRVAILELRVRARNTSSEAVRAELLADRATRHELVLEGIRTARNAGAGVILCPGWTFVSAAPAVRALAASARGAAVVFEVLHAGRGRLGPRATGNSRKRSGSIRSTPFVFEAGSVRPLARQVFARGSDLKEPRIAHEFARALANRQAGGGILLCCGEVNVVRRRMAGGRVEHVWDRSAEAAGARAQEFTGRLVLNPAHTPNGSYVQQKRLRGPWRVLVSTANTFNLPRARKAAQAVRIGHALDAAFEKSIDGRGSRVVVYDVP